MLIVSLKKLFVSEQKIGSTCSKALSSISRLVSLVNCHTGKVEERLYLQSLDTVTGAKLRELKQ